MWYELLHGDIVDVGVNFAAVVEYYDEDGVDDKFERVGYYYISRWHGYDDDDYAGIGDVDDGMDKQLAFQEKQIQCDDDHHQ